MHTQGTRAVLAGLAAALLAACASGSASGAAAEGDSLRIGVAAATGPATLPYFNGVELAVEHLNARRGPGQPPFALRRPLDDQSSQVAVAAAFRDDPAVIGVVGHTGSAQTREAAPIYGDVEGGGRRAVVAVTPTATNPAVTRLSEWVFRTCPTDDDAARALARFATDSLGARRGAAIYRNDLFGRGFTRAFRAAFEERGGALEQRHPYLGGITPFDAYAGRIAEGRAEIVMIAGGGVDAVEMIRELRRAGADPAIFGTDDVSTLEADPATAAEFQGVRYTTFFHERTASSGEAVRFVREYRERYGLAPDHRAALAYDAAMLIGTAALQAGPGRRRVRDWIAEVGRSRAAFAGVTGEIRFDEWGDPVEKPLTVTEVRP